MVLRGLTKKEKELIELITEYSSCYSKEKLNMLLIIKFDEITKETKKELLKELLDECYTMELKECGNSKVLTYSDLKYELKKLEALN